MKVKDMINYLNFIADKDNTDYVLITKKEYQRLKTAQIKLKIIKKELDKLNSI